MSHLEPDRLVLLALGEEPLDEHETGHLDRCDACRAEIAELRAVAGVGRETRGLTTLPAPPERVWQRITAELAGSGTATSPTAVTGRTEPTRPAPVDELAVRRGLRAARPSWLTTGLVATAAALAAVAGTLFAVDRSRPEPATLACASDGPTSRLAPLTGAPSGVRGEACLVTDGTDRKLRLRADGMPAPTGGDYEVWLLDSTSLQSPEGLRMKPLGTLGSGTDQAFVVPAGLDLSKYNIVDVSAEPHDGNASHSGRSLLRGTLS